MQNMQILTHRLYASSEKKKIKTSALMNKFNLIFVFILISGYLSGQLDYVFSDISEMRWELDYEVYLKMKNDSAYTFDIGQLFHIKDEKPNPTADFIFYPVNLDKEYINSLNARYPGENNLSETTSYKTLWSALHKSLGGGWVHFTNCLLYSLESQQLKLDAPLMKRNTTEWKPDPLTDSYKRTRKWEYFIPLDQKLAIKEYKIRIQKGELGDLKNIPSEFIELFLKTKNKDYQEYIETGEVNKIAKIDLIRILLGANFLGEIQINYIRSQVLNSVKSYSLNNIPSVLIFDEFDAAGAISMDLNGYKIESIAFKATANLSKEQIVEYQKEIIKIIDDINIYNQNSFRKKLHNYYRK